MSISARYKKRPIGSISSLARALDVDQKTLVDVARNSVRYWCPGETIIVPNKDPRKTNNARNPLKSIHGKIKTRILDHVEFPAYVMGGIASDEFNKRDYVCHAEMHAGKSILVSEDIKSFYPSTTASTINDIWKGFFNFHPAVANMLTLLTTYKGALPQGWIPSTHLANLALWRHEPDMVQALGSLGFVYTRFVDDMTASSQEPVENEKKTEVVSTLIGLMKKCGFKPKRSKHSLALAGDCMKVVNLNVDRETPSMCKSERNRTRSYMHKCETYSPTARNSQEYIQIWNKASGRVSNLKRLHPKEAELYRDRLSSIRPQRPKRNKSKTAQVPVS